MTENQIFALILMAFMTGLIVLILIAIKRRNETEKEPEDPSADAAETAPEEEAVLMGSLAKASARSRAKGEMSMDEAYARAHGQWVCPFCETINDGALNICQACGQPRG